MAADDERVRRTVLCAPLNPSLSSNGNSRHLCAWAEGLVGRVVDYLVWPARDGSFLLALIEFADAEAARQLVEVGHIRNLCLGDDIVSECVKFRQSTHVIRRQQGGRVFPEKCVLRYEGDVCDG